MVFQTPRGMKDIEPDEMAKRKWVYARIRKVLDSYGYYEMEPSSIEYFKTLAAKSGEDVKDEIYYFKDKAGRELGLRFDLSVGIARMAANTQFTKPLKVYSISNMWRYDAPQFGRYRCFYQWDVEILGSEFIESDAEIIAVNVDILKKLKLNNFEVRINNRKIVEGVLNYFGVPEDKFDDAMRIIDKIGKLPRIKIITDFRKIGVERVQIDEILSALSRKGKPVEVLKGIIGDFPDKEEKINEGVAELEELYSCLKFFGVANKCVFDLSVVRGLGYYTGIVFEIFDKNHEDIGAIAGGGRFDNLVKIYGSNDVPATGAAGGMERLMLALEKNNLIPETKATPKMYVAPTNENVIKQSIKIANTLRKKGKTVEMGLMRKTLQKQLKHANKNKIPVVIIVGENDLKKKQVTARDMKTGKEKKVKVVVGSE